jgi:hypothetical protein
MEMIGKGVLNGIDGSCKQAEPAERIPGRRHRVNFGTPITRPGNAVEFQMRRNNIKHIVQALDRISHKAVLINQEKVITVYNLEKR